jgi:hypothetical protein
MDKIVTRIQEAAMMKNMAKRIHDALLWSLFFVLLGGEVGLNLPFVLLALVIVTHVLMEFVEVFVKYRSAQGKEIHQLTEYDRYILRIIKRMGLLYRPEKTWQ